LERLDSRFRKFWSRFFQQPTPTAGLPDGLISNKKIPICVNFDKFYGHLDFFLEIWDIV
jgi:hypothetical protein